jgi:hypothetical protein
VDVAGTAYAAAGVGDGGGCGGGGDDYGLNLLEVRGTFGIWNILVASPFGLRSGLRQSGSAFGGAFFYGMRERMPFRSGFYGMRERMPFRSSCALISCGDDIVRCNGGGRCNDRSRSSAIPPQRAKTARRGSRFGEGRQPKKGGCQQLGKARV